MVGIEETEMQTAFWDTASNYPAKDIPPREHPLAVTVLSSFRRAETFLDIRSLLCRRNVVSDAPSGSHRVRVLFEADVRSRTARAGREQ